jgi:dTDP-4-amino-4,6-dideoxygalactose transaminase
MSGLTIQFTGLKKQYHNLRQEILNATDEVLRSGQLMNGNHTAEFENWLAKRNRSKYAVTVHSGTCALECIAEYYVDQLTTINHPTVLIPSMTYAATANAFARAGWQIHFVDTDKFGIFDFNKTPDIDRFDALVLVGLYGLGIHDYGNLEKFNQTLRLRNLIVIEDAAQHWLSSGGIRIGQAAAISFDPMKNLNAIGNGGAIVTDDVNLYYFARAWRDNGKDNHVQNGTNSRMSEVDCAVLMIKTHYIDQWQKRREEIATYWRSRLAKTGVRCLINNENARGHGYQKFVIDCDHRDQLQNELKKHKIETRIHYQYPLHELSVFRQYPGPDILSSASALSRRVLSLPFYPELSDLEVEYVVDQVLDCVAEIDSR